MLRTRDGHRDTFFGFKNTLVVYGRFPEALLGRWSKAGSHSSRYLIPRGDLRWFGIYGVDWMIPNLNLNSL